jgi:glycosyltransferase involved in cell wall biosynthesis
VSAEPEVSVVMAVYDGREHLGEAIESVLGQTYGSFEFVVIDDGSTDGSREVIEAHRDARLRLLSNPKNLGLAASLNRAIRESRGRLVARMDADDIAFPERLAKQVAHLDAHPDVGVCGTWIRTFGRRERTWRYPAGADDLRAELLFRCPLAHSSVTMRRSLVSEADLHYDETLSCAQDYDLWARAAFITKLTNLPEVLLKRREHGGQVGVAQRQQQVETTKQIRGRLLARLGVEASDYELAMHGAYGDGRFGEDAGVLADFLAWTLRLLRANGCVEFAGEQALGAAVAARWLRACRKRARSGTEVWRSYRRAVREEPRLRSRLRSELELYLACLVSPLTA